ncbi:hypothetical protein D3C71_1926020 [compost metagenome]
MQVIPGCLERGTAIRTRIWHSAEVTDVQALVRTEPAAGSSWGLDHGTRVIG